jgi:hypothetical protein
MDQGCEKQKKCRDEAVKLIRELDIFFVMRQRVEQLDARTETKRAIERMLELVKQVCDYFCKHTSKGILGESSMHLRAAAT